MEGVNSERGLRYAIDGEHRGEHGGGQQVVHGPGEGADVHPHIPPAQVIVFASIPFSPTSSSIGMRRPRVGDFRRLLPFK
jgi:hypothetical protein